MNKSAVDAIYSAGIKLLLPLTPEETYKTISEEAIKLVDAEYASVFLEVNNKLLRVYASNDFLYKVKIQENGHTYRAYRLEKPSVLSIEVIASFHPQIKAKGVKSTIFIPLAYKNKSIGILVVHSLRKTKFSPEETSILKLFGSYASLAIRKTQLYAETKRALEMRDKFISVVAHELRTPLTAIHGYLQLMLKRSQRNEEFDTNWVKEMYGESMRINNLINELVEVNHIESRKQVYHFALCQTENIIPKAIDQIKIMFPKREIRFENKLHKSTFIIGDKNRILQVIISLLDNGAKFSSSNTPITITLSQSAKYQHITIKDEGKGISKKELPHIFEGFYKGENNQKAGMGVGLMLVKTIIKKHRGSLSIKSKAKIGTLVEIRLPIASL